MPDLDIDTFYKELGKLIKTERIKRGINQEILGNQLELTRASVINLEKGRHKPSIYQLIIIAEILNIEYTSLIPSLAKGNKKFKKVGQNSIENAVSDQESINKSTKNTLLDFLSSIKKV